MFSYKFPSGVLERIGTLEFNPQSLPRETVHNCDLCGDDRQQIISWFDRYGFDERFVLCERCGLIFLSPRPTAEGYEIFYEKYYRPLVTALNGRPETAQSIIPGQRSYADYVVRFLMSAQLLKEGQQVIDIGGSTGVVSAALQERGLDCLVLDPCPDELEVAKRFGLQTERGLIETWPNGGRRFDLALVCQTVDHFLSVRRALEKIHDLLNPGGLIFLDVTDFESRARNHKEFRGFLKLDHCFYLSDRTMRAYFSATGFEVILADLSRRKLTYACRRVSEKRQIDCMEGYARAMGVMLRDLLVSPKPEPYPVDLLTRVWRQFRSNGIHSH